MKRIIRRVMGVGIAACVLSGPFVLLGILEGWTIVLVTAGVTVGIILLICFAAYLIVSE